MCGAETVGGDDDDGMSSRIGPERGAPKPSQELPCGIKGGTIGPGFTGPKVSILGIHMLESCTFQHKKTYS